MNYNQQDATLYNILIAVNAIHVSGGFPPVIRSSNCAYSIWYMSSLLVATASVGEFAVPTHPR
jgi:hypothetical protein